jgi:hypothetical protein
MSLIVAGFENGSLTIVADTKLTYPGHMDNSLKNHVNSGVTADGILKLIIVSEHICIGFAGDVEYAENAIREINPNRYFENVLNTLVKHHQESDRKTDFILCINTVTPSIFVIKDGEFKLSNHGWIGDKLAFERFQKSRIADNKSISSAIDDVINDESIKTVGGFNVSVHISNGRFVFGNYMNMHREAMSITLIPNKPFIIGHGTAENGAYTLSFIGASKNCRHVAFHIKQGNFGIVYSRTGNGLLRPEIKPCMDEVDFHDYIKSHFGILPLGTTQDRFQKFYSAGMNAYKSRDFSTAISFFDRAINEAKDCQKPQPMFYKGICFHYMKNSKAWEVFRDVINLDNSYQSKIQEFFKTQIQSSTQHKDSSRLK